MKWLKRKLLMWKLKSLDRDLAGCNEFLDCTMLGDALRHGVMMHKNYTLLLMAETLAELEELE